MMNLTLSGDRHRGDAGDGGDDVEGGNGMRWGGIGLFKRDEVKA